MANDDAVESVRAGFERWRARRRTAEDREAARDGKDRDDVPVGTDPDDQRTEIRTDDDAVEKASEDSFPASDPPSYTGSTGG